MISKSISAHVVHSNWYLAVFLYERQSSSVVVTTSVGIPFWTLNPLRLIFWNFLCVRGNSFILKRMSVLSPLNGLINYKFIYHSLKQTTLLFKRFLQLLYEFVQMLAFTELQITSAIELLLSGIFSSKFETSLKKLREQVL